MQRLLSNGSLLLTNNSVFLNVVTISWVFGDIGTSESRQFSCLPVNSVILLIEVFNLIITIHPVNSVILLIEALNI